MIRNTVIRSMVVVVGVLIVGGVAFAEVPSRDAAIERREHRDAAVAQRKALEGKELEAFFHAITFNETAEIRKYLRLGFSPEQVDSKGNTALVAAVRSGNLNVVRTLINAGAEMNRADRFGDTPIMVAAITNRRDIVEYFISKGVRVNKEGWTPLHYAATAGNNEIVNLLIDNLADIDARAPNGTTPLMMAVRQNRPSTVKLLLDRGADKNFKTDTGATAFDWAQDKPEILRLLNAGDRKQGTGNSK